MRLALHGSDSRLSLLLLPQVFTHVCSRHHRQRAHARRGPVCMPQSVPKVPYRNPKDRRIQWVEIFNVLVRCCTLACIVQPCWLAATCGTQTLPAGLRNLKAGSSGRRCPCCTFLE